MSINKFKNAWISNDSSLNGGVSLINSGKSTFKDTVSIGLTGATGQQLTVNGDINYTGNLLKNGIVDTVSISGTNNFTGQNTFSNLTFNNVSSNIPVNNYNFSLTTAGNYTPILNNVSGTNSITGWTFSGNNYTIFINDSVMFSGENRYIPGLPSPSNTYLILEKTNGSTFTLSTSGLNLSVGDYTLSFSSYWGTQSNTAIVTVNIGNASFVYNDSSTRLNGLWTSNTFQFSIGTSGINNIQFVYTDTTANVVDICISNIVVVKYNDFRITDGSNIAFVSPTLSKLNNTNLTGLTNIIGTSIVKGSLTCGSAYGTNNCVINNSFSSSSSGSTNSSCIAIGGIIQTNTTNANKVVSVGNSISVSNSSLNAVAVGNTIGGCKLNDTFIGSNVNGLGGNNTLIGYSIGNSLGVGQYNVCIGHTLLSAYNGYGYYTTTPARNVAIGTNLLGASLDNYNIAMGYNNLNGLQGNNNNVSPVRQTALITQYNIALGNNICNTQGNLNNCIFLGNTISTTNAISNSIVIGNSIGCTGSNQVVIGSNTQTVYINGNLNVSGTSTITGYLTSALASSTYQPIGSYLTSASLSGYATINYVDSNFATPGGNNTFSGANSFINVLPNSPITPANDEDLITKIYADTKFQTITNMASYLLNSSASDTYQTISGMSNYFTGSYISSTYQTIANMSSYLTTASASTTYQPIFKSSALITSNTTITNLNTIYTFCHLSNAAITVTLPTGLSPSNAPVLSFRRIGGIPNSNTNTILNAVVGNQPIYSFNSTSLPFINTTYQICSSLNIYTELQLIVINPSNLGAGSCTITNGSATINVTSVVSGVRLCVGTSITVRNAANNTFFTKTLISITSGTGGVGSYVMDSTYNFGQTNTSIVINTSYGWAINRLT